MIFEFRRCGYGVQAEMINNTFSKSCICFVLWVSGGSGPFPFLGGGVPTPIR